MDSTLCYVQKLGRGSYGEVELYRRSTEGVVLKKTYGEDDEGIEDSALIEIGVLKHVNSPHVLKLIDFNCEEEYVAIELPYIRNGDLLEGINKIPPEHYKSFMFKLALGIKDYTERGILNRDLKPDNVLLEGHDPVIADFGIAMYNVRTDSQTPIENSDHCYTLWCRPPELLLGSEFISEKSEIWALGLIFFFILTKLRLFTASSGMEMLGSISSKLGLFKEENWPGVSKFRRYQEYIKRFEKHPVLTLAGRKDKIRKLLAKKTSIDERLVDLIFRTLSPDPNQRLDIIQVLNHSYFDELRTQNFTRVLFLESPQNDSTLRWNPMNDVYSTEVSRLIQSFAKIRTENAISHVDTISVHEAIHNYHEIIYEEIPLKSVENSESKEFDFDESYKMLHVLFCISQKMKLQIVSEVIEDFEMLLPCNLVYWELERDLIKKLKNRLITTTPLIYWDFHSEKYSDDIRALSRLLILNLMLTPVVQNQKYSEVSLVSILMACTILKKSFLNHGLSDIFDFYTKVVNYIETHPPVINESLSEDFKVAVSNRITSL